MTDNVVFHCFLAPSSSTSCSRKQRNDRTLFNGNAFRDLHTCGERWCCPSFFTRPIRCIEIKWLLALDPPSVAPYCCGRPTRSSVAIVVRCVGANGLHGHLVVFFGRSGKRGRGEFSRFGHLQRPAKQWEPWMVWGIEEKN